MMQMIIMSQLSNTEIPGADKHDEAICFEDIETIGVNADTDGVGLKSTYKKRMSIREQVCKDYVLNTKTVKTSMKKSCCCISAHAMVWS